MQEMLRIAEKKILPALMMAVIGCQGGKAFAEEILTSNVNIEDHERQKALYEEFGEAYRLFEQSIDETTDDELKAAGISGDPIEVRSALKRALRLLWRWYGEGMWAERSVTQAVVRYDILTSGAKLFFRIEEREKMVRFDEEDYERQVEEIIYRIRDLTGISVDRVSDMEDANCIVTFAPSSEEKKNAKGTRPTTSFMEKQAKIFLPIQRIREADGHETEDSNIQKFLRSFGQTDEDGYKTEASNIQKFLRSYGLVDSALHEFCHVVGLGHWNESGDIMSSLPNEFQIEPVNEPARLLARDLIYVRSVGAYLKVSLTKKAEVSVSIKLVRWLRWQAIKGTLKGLLEKAEELAVKRPVNKQKSQ